MIKKGLILYGLAWVVAFALAALVRETAGLDAGMKVWDAAVCILILPFQLIAAVIARFSATPGAIDDYAINNFFTLLVIVAAFVLFVRFAWGKLKSAWHGGGGHAHGK